MPTAEDPHPRPAEGPEPDGKDPFEGLVLDEDFVRGAEVREQSGRTRMLAARWKHTPPVDPGGRRSVNDGPKKKRFAHKPRPVDPWGNPVARRRVEWRTPLFVALAIALLLAFLNVDGLREWTGRDSGSGTARQPVPTVAPETARPTTAPPPVDPEQSTVARPWAGSPAEGWPNGAEAFVLPPARAEGVFTAEQVAAQLRLVKDYLTAAHLDPKVIAGARPDAALAMLDREDRDSALATFDKPSQQSDPTLWVSRFDPREAIPATDTVKVQGFLRFEGDGERGVLVHTDFTYVYALRPGPEAAARAASPAPTGRPQPSGTPAAPAPGDGAVKPVGLVVPVADVPGDTWTARTIVRRVDTFRFHNPGKFQVDPKRPVRHASVSEAGNTACGLYDGYYHPRFAQFDVPDGPIRRPSPSGPTEDPYDRSKELQVGGECGTVSRS
ncbi:SCO2583/SCO2584 N-terminal domain-containing protein [Kitasatospora sp. NPDC054939]